MERILAKFEASTNFHTLWCLNEWINHPDSYYVSEGVFKEIFKKYFGGLNLLDFLCDSSYHKNNFNVLQYFYSDCMEVFEKLSYDEVESAHDRLSVLMSDVSTLTA